MPFRYGDPGVFACGPDDIDPPWPSPPRPPTGSGRPVTGVWLVLRGCRNCTRLYCKAHDRNNFWLSVYDGPPFRKRAT